MSEPVRLVVRVGDCPCPGTPHAEEWVDLEPELLLPTAAAAWAAVTNTDVTIAAQQAALIEAYLPRSIRAWSFTDTDNGRAVPVPISRDAMERLLPWDKGGLELANRADGLYSERLMRPLVAAMSKLSPSGPTPDSTSASQEPGDSEPAPSARSSRTAGDGKLSAVPDR